MGRAIKEHCDEAVLRGWSLPDLEGTFADVIKLGGAPPGLSSAGSEPEAGGGRGKAKSTAERKKSASDGTSGAVGWTVPQGPPRLEVEGLWPYWKVRARRNYGV